MANYCGAGGGGGGGQSSGGVCVKGESGPPGPP